MKISEFILLMGGLALLCLCPAGAPAADSDLFALDLEELLSLEVVSASKVRQKISDSPNAITVITAEDIRHSGAVDLPDLFRMVPGVDVVGETGNAYGVSARGFNMRFASRMLVMIDGRSIYTPFFGGVFWENEEVFLEDIERIEVIRGPGASLWGANAVNGVINIITKDPEADPGFLVSARAGTKHFRETVFRYSRCFSDRLSASLTGGYREDEGTRGVNDFRRVPKATARVKYRLTDDAVLHFFTGVNESEIGLDEGLYTHRADARVRSNYQMLRWEHRFSKDSELNVQTCYSQTEYHSDDKKTKINEDRFDIEFDHTFALGDAHRLTWGGNFRDTAIDSTYLLRTREHDDIVGLFAQDEIRLSRRLRLVLGLKYENNSFTGRDFSPRGCLLFELQPNHHLRLSVSRAFRTPSFGEDGLYREQTVISAMPRLSTIAIVGNRDLEPERMTAYEIGYRGTLAGKIGLNIELYYNDMDRNISNRITKGKFPIKVTFDNLYHVVAKGVEVCVSYPVTRSWTLEANYTYQEVERKRINSDKQGTPRHKFNVSFRCSLQNGFSFDLRAHFVDATKWESMTDETVRVDDYLRVDVRLAQRLFNDRLEAALVCQNLTDRFHSEAFQFKAERLIYGQLTWRFE